MLKRYYPGATAESVFDIDYQKLYDLGYRALLFDVDNTLVHHGDAVTDEVERLFCDIHKIGLKTLLLSNNSEQRLALFSRNLNTLYIAEAQKPKPDSYLKAAELLGEEKERVLCIGDQVFTDILGANNSGIDSILVHFIQPDKNERIGIRRHVEQWILRLYRHSKAHQRIGQIRKQE